MHNVVSPAERELITDARLDDLNLNLIRHHIQDAVAKRGYEGPTDLERYLQMHHLISEQTDGTIVPTLAGMLTFGREPERWISASGVDIAQFHGSQSHSTDLVFSRQIRGGLMTIIDQIVEVLWARSDHYYRLEGTERIEEHAYSAVVLREISANAIAHRDWQFQGSRVRIQMFPDRIEWISPGGLPLGITAANLREEQALRNPTIAQILYQSGKIESFGMGIDTVEDTLRSWGSRPLEVIDAQRQVIFTVFAKSLERQVNRSTSADRLIRILALIDQMGAAGISDLAQQLSVSRRTLQYDLQKLVDQGELIVRGATNNRRYQRP